jgi:hypothetical protein
MSEQVQIEDEEEERRVAANVHPEQTVTVTDD